MNRRPEFFGQNGEDFLLWTLFSERPTPGGPGWIIDVGAFDGVYLSNSLAFERSGWPTMCVEPHPVYSRLCRSARRGSVVVRAACVAPGSEDRVNYNSEPMGLYSGVATPDEEDLAHRHRLRLRRVVASRPTPVRAVTLAALIAEHVGDAPIDLISIDTEGTEADVLAGADLPRTRPRTVLVEADSGDEHKQRLKALMADAGYLVGCNIGGNIVFARDRSDALRLREIPVDCVLSPMRHPLGTAATIPAYLHGRRLGKAPTPSSPGRIRTSVRTPADRMRIAVLKFLIRTRPSGDSR